MSAEQDDQTKTVEDQLFYRNLIDTILLDSHVQSKRSWLHQLIEAKLREDEKQFILLCGEAGSGKTHFLAQLASNKSRSLRYFMRSDSRNSLAYGDARTFLLRIGHQLAALHPEAFLETLNLVAEQNIDVVDKGGDVTGIRVESMQVSPFHNTALRVHQQVRLVQGDLVGIEVRHMISDPEMLSVPTLERLAMRRPAEMLSGHPEKILVLIDAIDEARFNPGFNVGATLIDWLASAPNLPKIFQFVVTARPDSVLLERLRKTRAEDLFEVDMKDHLQECVHDVAEYARNVLRTPEADEALRRDGGNAGMVAQLVTSDARGNFQYAATILRSVSTLHSVRSSSGDEGDELVESRIIKTPGDAASALPGSLENLYTHYLALLRDQSKGLMVEITDEKNVKGWTPGWQSVYRPILSVLAMARSPLSIEEIIEFAGINIGKEWILEVLGSLGQFLNKEKNSQRFQLFHPSIAEFLTSDSAKALTGLDCYVDASEWHLRFSDVLSKQLSNAGSEVSSYAKLHLAYHAFKADRLAQLLELPKFLIQVEPDGLAGLLNTEPLVAQIITRAYFSVYDLIRNLDENSRASYLEWAAREFGLSQLADSIAAMKHWGEWSIRWTQAKRKGGYRRVLPANINFSAMTTSWIDGRPAVIGVTKGAIELQAYDLLTGQYLRGCQLELDTRITALAVTSSRVDNLVALGASDGTVYIINFENSKFLGDPRQQHSSSVRSITIEHDEQSIYVVSTDTTGVAKCFDAASGTQVHSSVIDSVHPDDTSDFALSLPADAENGINIEFLEISKIDPATLRGPPLKVTDRDGNPLAVSRMYNTQVAFARVSGQLVLFWNASSKDTNVVEFLTGKHLHSIRIANLNAVDLKALSLSTGKYVFMLAGEGHVCGLRFPPTLDIGTNDLHVVVVNPNARPIQSVSAIELSGQTVMMVWLAEGIVYAHEMNPRGQIERELSTSTNVGRLHDFVVNGRTVILGGDAFGIVDGRSIRLDRTDESRLRGLHVFDPYTGTSLGDLFSLSGLTGICDFTICVRGERSFIALSAVGVHTIVLVDLADSSITHIDASSLGAVTALSFANIDSRQCLLAGSNAGRIVCFSLDSLKPIGYIQSPDTKMIVDFALLQMDGRLVIASVGWCSSTITFQDFNSDEILFERLGSTGGDVSAFVVRADENLLVTGDTKGFVRLLRLTNGHKLLEFYVGSRVLGLTLIGGGIAVSTPLGMMMYNIHPRPNLRA